MYSLFVCLSLVLKISVIFLKFSKVLFIMMVENCWQRLQMTSGFSDNGNRQWELNCQSRVIPRAVVRFIQRGPVHFEGDISWGLSSRFKSLGAQAHLLKAQGSPYHTLSRMLPAQSLWGQIPGP